jgi:transposase-like protein
MDMWKAIIFDKDADAMNRMVEYCDMDVIVLEKVFEKLQPYTKKKVNYAVLRGGEKFECPECGSFNIRMRKTYTTAAGTIQHYMSCECGNSSYKINNKTFIDWLQWKMKNNIK